MTVRSFDKLYVGGAWVAPSSDRIIESISPVTEEVLATVPAAVETDIDAAVDAAREAFDYGPWPRLTPAERGTYLQRIGAELAERLPEMQAAFTAEIGAPEALSVAFHDNAVKMWADAATLHEQLPLESERTWDGGRGTLVREPIGVVAAIVPWNAPVANATMKLGPALAAGCTVVLKPSPEGASQTLLLAEAIHAAGLPAGVVSVLPAERDESEYLVRHPKVDKVAFTGSTVAGKRIMSLCGERVARVTLELG